MSYDAVYFPFDVPQEKVEADLDSLVQFGVNSLYLTVSEEDAENPRKIEMVLGGAHARGLRVYLNPYIGGTFSGDEGDSAEQYLQDHPEDEMVSRLGEGSDLPSLVSEIYRTYLKATLSPLLAHDFDGVMLDEPFFPQGSPGNYFPFDDKSRTRFSLMFGHEMPVAEDEEVVRFRESVMNEFLTELFDFVRSMRPDLTTILVVMPDLGERDFLGTDDWHTLSRIDSLDVFQIDPYWYDRGWEWFVANIDKLQSEANGSGSTIGAWVQAYGMTSDYERISRSLEYLRDQGIPFLAAWVTEVLPNDDMDATWSAIADVYLQGQS